MGIVAPLASPPTRRSLKLICVGDSITNQNSNRPNTPLGSHGSTAYTQTLGWLPWALGMSGGLAISWDPTFGNFGVGGDQTTDILARMGPILASRADLATLLVGVNDIAIGIQASKTPAVVLAELKANYLKIVSQLRGAGIRPICFTILPAGGTGGWSDGMRGCLLAFNDWLRGFGRVNGIEVFDAYRVLADPTLANGGAFSGTTLEGLHPIASGAFLIAKAFALRLQALAPALQRTQYGVSDVFSAANNPSGNLLSNALFLTTSAMPVISGVTASGVIPAGWTFSRESGTGTTGTVVGAVEAAADGNGNWFKLTFDDLDGTTEIYRLLLAIPTSFIAFGEILEGYGEVRQAAGQVGGALNLISWGITDSTNTVASYTAMTQGSNAGTVPTEAFTLYLETPSAQIAASGTLFVRMMGRVSIQVSGGGPYSGEVMFRLPTVRKRST